MKRFSMPLPEAADPAVPSLPATGFRVVVVGSSGAGKSTVARALALNRTCPLVELDELYWAPGWVARETDDFRARVAQATAGDAWVVAGNYSVARDLFWSRAQVIVWLDLGLPRVWWRGLRRTLALIASGRELHPGNRETFARAFLSRQSILLWIVSNFRPCRHKLTELQCKGFPPGAVWMRARHPGEVDAILQALTRAH